MPTEFTIGIILLPEGKPMEQYLNQIESFARQAHGSQKRKYTDELYINHPVRVKEKCRQYQEGFIVLAAALLHDVLEDTPVSQQDLKNFLQQLLPDAKVAVDILTVVVELTDTFTKSNYPSMNRRRRKESEAERLATVSYSAQTVKYADIIDNTDIALHDRHFAVVYFREVSNILALMKNGNPKLKIEAVDQVNRCMGRLNLQPILRS